MRKNASFNSISLLKKPEDHQPFHMQTKPGVQSVGIIPENTRSGNVEVRKWKCHETRQFSDCDEIRQTAGNKYFAFFRSKVMILEVIKLGLESALGFTVDFCTLDDWFNHNCNAWQSYCTLLCHLCIEKCAE